MNLQPHTEEHLGRGMGTGDATLLAYDEFVCGNAACLISATRATRSEARATGAGS